MAKFAPLHIKSGYTFLSSGLTIEKIQESVKKNDYFGAAISDDGVMYGVPMFAKAMENINKPYIIGLDIPLEEDNVSLYATDEESYRLICHISSLIQQEKFDYHILLNNHKGLIGVIDTSTGSFKNYSFEENKNKFIGYISDLSNLFDTLYLGINITSVEERHFADIIRRFAKTNGFKTIAFPKIEYQEKKDAIVLDIVTAIRDDQTLDHKEKEGQNYFMSEENYAKIYTQEEINNTIKVIQSNSLSFHKKRGSLLHYSNEDSKELLHKLCLEGLNKKNINDEKHIARLEMELDVINQMGYADYFLIVQDYVNYAKNHDIIVGPGRGSAAGSLVSYSLNITEIDPLDYNLQFERFLNVARKSMPDIDIDFMDTKRDEMVQYLRDKYGNEKVASIVTFQTILARQSLRDIGRVYSYNENHISMLCKAITDPKGTLRDAYKQSKAFRDLVNSDKYFLEIVSLASKIEGLPRQSGLHAAGVVLNNEAVEKDIPISVDFSGNIISQYEMHFLEEQGFLKMDFLALRNLTIIDKCVEFIKERHPETDINNYTIPYNDKDSFSIIREGMTMGVFQLESAGMKLAISKVKPTCLEDIVITLALFRPGPMDNINDYVLRKTGKKNTTYLSKEIQNVLEETYGILVYQEQVNSLAQVMAGFSPSDADVFRRAVSKKDKAVLAKQGQAFIEGSIAKGYKKADAEKMFNDILKFADYGFNKSHSVGYSIIASRMAYLKYHYPLEFYAAILKISSNTTNDGKFNEYISEMKKRNFDIYLPNINVSNTDFKIEKNGIIFPLTSIKGINALFVNNLLEERNKNGEFIDIFDFALRMYAYKISEKQLSALVDAGALDIFSKSRATLRNAILPALQYADLCYSDGQLILSPDFTPKPSILEEDDIPLDKLEREYNALGIMVSDNPLKYKKDLLVSNKVSSISEMINDVYEKVASSEDENSYYYNRRIFNSEGTICGIIRSIKLHNTRKNNSTMAFIKIFDETGESEVIIFNRTYDECYQYLKKNNIVVINGKMEFKDDKYSFIADSLKPLEE